MIKPMMYSTRPYFKNVAGKTEKENNNKVMPLSIPVTTAIKINSMGKMANKDVTHP